MIIVYLDESGSPYANYESYEKHCPNRISNRSTATSSPYPFFVLASLGLEEHHLPVVDDWFEGIKQSFFGASGLPSAPQYEIKGSLLYLLREGKEPTEWSGHGRVRGYSAQQRDVWRSLQNHQIELLERSVFDLLRRIKPVVWIVVVKQAHIFRKHKHATWPPYYWALTYLQQRVLHHVQALHGAYGRAMFLMDETSTLKTAADFDTFLSVRDRINDTAAWPVEFRRYLVEIPLFAKSHLHQGLQLVDIVSHAAWRHVKKRDSLRWFERIEPFLARHWQTGEHENAGMTFIK